MAKPIDWAALFKAGAGRIMVIPEMTVEPTCDCSLNPHHRWNCPLTPIWAQTIRELDYTPWTVVTG